jgi:hypothetical protein
MKMVAKWVGGALLGALFLCPRGAQAQETFGSEGQFAVSGERLFGVTWSTQSSEEGDVKSTQSYTNISLLANPYGPFVSAYSFPRVGADFFVIDGLSVGAALGLFTVSSSSKVEAGDQEQEEDGPSLSGFLLAPRIGYAAMFNETVGIWPRGGITYVNASSESSDGDSETTSSSLALTIEAPLVIAPVPHVALTIGPTLDFGLSGSTERTTTDPTTGEESTDEEDVDSTDIGLQAGITVWF